MSSKLTKERQNRNPTSQYLPVVKIVIWGFGLSVNKISRWAHKTSISITKRNKVRAWLVMVANMIVVMVTKSEGLTNTEGIPSALSHLPHRGNQLTGRLLCA